MAKTLRTPTRKRVKDSIKPKIQALLDAGNVQEVIDNLTDMQRRFVEEYLVDFNGSAAVLRAGYASKYPNRAAYQLLQNPAVKAAINEFSVQNGRESMIKPEYVIDKIRKTLERAEAQGNHTAVLRAAELLARSLGMFVERKEISGPNGDAVRVEQVQEAADAFTSAVAGLIERGREDGSFIIVGPEC